jgi:transposase-like protein
MLCPMAQAAPKTTDFGDYHKTKLSPEGQARIIQLLFVQQLSVEVIAKRFGIGATTVRRIRASHCEMMDARKERDADR